MNHPVVEKDTYVTRGHLLLLTLKGQQQHRLQFKPLTRIIIENQFQMFTCDEYAVDKVGDELNPLGDAARHDGGRGRREHELEQYISISCRVKIKQYKQLTIS